MTHHHYYNLSIAQEVAEYLRAMQTSQATTIKLTPPHGKPTTYMQRIMWGLRYVREHEDIFGPLSAYAKSVATEQAVGGVRLTVRSFVNASVLIEEQLAERTRIEDNDYLLSQAAQWVATPELQAKGSFVRMRQNIIPDDIAEKLKQLVANHPHLDCFVKDRNVVICRKVT